MVPRPFLEVVAAARRGEHVEGVALVDEVLNDLRQGLDRGRLGLEVVHEHAAAVVTRGLLLDVGHELCDGEVVARRVAGRSASLRVVESAPAEVLTAVTSPSEALLSRLSNPPCAKTCALVDATSSEP